MLEAGAPGHEAGGGGQHLLPCTELRRAAPALRASASPGPVFALTTASCRSLGGTAGVDVPSSLCRGPRVSAMSVVPASGFPF